MRIARRPLPTAVEFVELVALTTESWRRYRLRTTLSSLGVVLGVAAVIAGLSISEGARQDALERISTLGLDNLVVRNQRSPREGQRLARGYGLVSTDARRLQALIPNLQAVAEVSQRVAFVSGPFAQRTATVLAASPEYQFIVRSQVVHGRLMTTIDQSAGRICVLGSALARELFRRDDPSGDYVRIGGEPYLVVGIITGDATAEPQQQPVGADLNQAVLVPAPAAGQLDRPIDEIWLRVRDGSQVSAVGDIVEQTVQDFHGGARDFDVVVPVKLLQERLSTQRMFNVMTTMTAALALLVGGIGIMNIMLASVLERTREIGLRRSVGASRQSIALQFLIESSAIGLLGGSFGVAVGVATSIAVSAYAGWRTEITLSTILLGLTASLVTAAMAGTYPAHRAAHLSPVEALDSE